MMLAKVLASLRHSYEARPRGRGAAAVGVRFRLQRGEAAGSAEELALHVLIPEGVVAHGDVHLTPGLREDIAEFVRRGGPPE
eukprot:14171859-Heterocapsa_arctica.AAC.1